MKVTAFTRRALEVRREERDMRRAGYRRHETDWEILRGGRMGEVILDAKIQRGRLPRLDENRATPRGREMSELREVETIYPSNFRDPAPTLRKIADEIDQMHVFGAGQDAEAPSVALLLHGGFLRLSRAIEEHGR